MAAQHPDELTTLTSCLAELTEAIGTVTTYLKEQNLPEPNLLKGNLPRHERIYEARNTIKRASAALGMLAEYNEQEYLSGLTAGLPYAFVPLHVVCKFGIPNAIGEDESVDIVELAKRVDCQDVERLGCIMRLCVNSWFFRQTGKDSFAHNKFSLKLRDPNQSALILLINECSYKAAPYVYDQLKTYPNSINPRESAWTFHNRKPGQEGYFEYLATNPEEQKLFHEGVAGAGKGIPVLSEVYPWKEKLDGKTVVDVGGSHGHISFEIAKLCPNSTFIVQDLPEVIQGAHDQKITPPPGVNATFEAHDFFSPQPRTADAYFMRFILHNHGDDRAVKILEGLVPVLEKGKGKVLVAETVITKDSRAPLGWANQMMHLSMIAVHNSGERTFDQYEALFKRADPRFRLKQYGSNGPVGSDLIEAWLEL